MPRSSAPEEVRLIGDANRTAPTSNLATPFLPPRHRGPNRTLILMTALPLEPTPPAAQPLRTADISAFRHVKPAALKSLLDGTSPPVPIAPLAPNELLVWLSLGSNLPLLTPPDAPDLASAIQPPKAARSSPDPLSASVPVSGAALTPTQILIQALHALHAICPVIALSSLWRTQPVDQPDQPLQAMQPDPLTAIKHPSAHSDSTAPAQPPRGSASQTAPSAPDFFNAAALLRTSLPIEQVLAVTQQIEQHFGRIRDPRYPKGPRTLDLDLILAVAGPADKSTNKSFEDPQTQPAPIAAANPASQVPAPLSTRPDQPRPVPILRESPTLLLPHPFMHLRRFVLAPMAELSPNLEHPRLQRSILQLLHSLGPASLQDAVECLSTPAWPSLTSIPAQRLANSESPA